MLRLLKNKARSFTTFAYRHTAIAGIVCLFAFFARYTVQLGHDCEVISPWVTLSHKAEVSGEICVSDQTLSAVQHEENNHNHEECPVCASYNQIVHALAQEHASILAFIENHEEINSSRELSSVFIQRIEPRTSRGPPSFIL